MKKVLGILLGVLLASNAYSQVTGSTIRVMNWGTYSNWLASMTETNVVIYPTSIITNLNVIVVTNLTLNITTNYSFYSSTNEQSYTIITNSPWVNTNGGTMGGSLLTSIDQLTTAPSENEFVTASWARNVASSGRAIYMTTNLFNAKWGPTNTTGVGSYVNGSQDWINFSVTGVNHYVASMIDTNPIPANTPLKGPATAHIHAYHRSGVPSGNYAFSAKVELYYTYDLSATSLTLGDFSANTQIYTAGITNEKVYTVSWPDVIPTNTYYRVFRLKATTVGSSTTNIVMGVGGTMSSFVQFPSSETFTLTAASIAAAGGLTNRAFVTPTALDCSPTTTITRAMIDSAPWGEMSLSLTGACYLTFDSTVTGTTDVATFGLYITGTNSLTWNTNLLTGTAWTNATATGSDRIFRKAQGKATVAIW